MKLVPTLLLFLSLILCTSCSLFSIEGSLQGLNSYNNKTKADNPDLLSRPDNSVPLCDLKTRENPKVYVTQTGEIASFFPKEGNAIVYMWFIQEKCTKENIDLFIVAE